MGMLPLVDPEDRALCVCDHERKDHVIITKRQWACVSLDVHECPCTRWRPTGEIQGKVYNPDTFQYGPRWWVPMGARR